MSNTLYNGQVTVRKVHPYEVVDSLTGITHNPPGVTTITGQFSKEAIPQWAANEAAKTALELRDSQLSYDEIYDLARKKYLTLRDNAADGGTEGHKWIEKYSLNELGEEYYFTSEHGIDFVEAYLEFENDHVIQEENPERLLFSRKYLYAGMRDNLALIDETLTTLDYKTGNPDFEYDQHEKRYTGQVRAYDAHFMQCAGYDIAEEEETGIRSGTYGVLYLVKTPKELCKKYGIPFRRYFYFTTTETEYWRNRFLNAVDTWYLANDRRNKYGRLQGN